MSNMVTTKAMAKVAAVATGLAMGVSMLTFASNAYAAALSASQIQSILSLLSSFGADASTIANVQASLTGGTPVSTPSTGSCSFSRNLTIGSSGADVTCLQKALIGGGFSIPAGASGYFGTQTRTAVASWQSSKNIAPAVGYFGSVSRAAFNLGGNTGTGMGTGTGTVPVGSGTGLKVMLSPTSPNGTVLVQGQGVGDLADYTFANPTSSAINVTTLTFKRTGVSNDSTLNNVYLYQGVTRITDSAGVSSGSFSFTNPAGIFTVAPGMSVTISVRADILTGTAGQQIGVSLVSAASSGTLDGSTSFPIMSGYQSISAANLATVSFASSVTPSATTISPQANFPVWQNTVTVSVNPVKLTSMKFTNLGSNGASAISNLRLYVDGTAVGSAVAGLDGNRSVTFDLSAAPVMLSTQGHVIKVLADITGGAGLTYQFSVQRTSDAMFVDNQLGQPVTPGSNGVTTSFTAVNAGIITMNAVSSTGGVSVSLDPASPNQNVAAGASSIKWASFDMLASGENVKVNDLYVFASSTQSTGALAGVGGLQNGKVYVNGVQVGSTKNIGSLVAGVTDFALGSSLILPAGVVTHVDIYADAKDTAGTNLPNNSTVIVSLNGTASLANAQGQSSLASTNVPSSVTSGSTITVSSSALTATKYSGYGNQTMVSGTNNAKLGSFTLSAGSTEGVSVNTVSITMSAANAASLTNLWLRASNGNGCNDMSTQVGTTITTPSATNSFSMSTDIPVSSTKTFDVCGNILSGANAGTILVTVGTATSGTGDVTGSSVTVSPALDLQSIIVGNGSLSISRGAGDPVSANVLAGAASVKVGQFNFAAANTWYTVQNLAILVPNGVASSVNNITVSYKDVNGQTQTQTQALAVSASKAYATATFTGLTFYVPTNDSANIDVYAGTPTIASGATSGAAINVSLDAGGVGSGNADFRAVNAAGSSLTIVNSGTNLASNGTLYVRKSIPTFAMLASGNPSNAPSNPLYRFSITADPAGAIEWSKLKFTLSTTSVTLSSPYIVDESTGLSILDNNVTSASTTVTSITVDLTQNNSKAQYQQIAAGTTKIYDLDATLAGFTTGSTLNISLAADGSVATANNTASAQTGSTVWSDRSASPHTSPSLGVAGSSDFTNGYLLQNFTTNTTSYSK